MVIIYNIQLLNVTEPLRLSYFGKGLICRNGYNSASSCAYLGYLGTLEVATKNRRLPICVASSKVAKAGTATVAVMGGFAKKKLPM